MDDRYFWSDDEIRMLMLTFPDATYPINDIAVQLGRSKAAIYHKAKSLGLIRLNPHYKSWSPDEEHRLAQLYADPQIRREDLEHLFKRKWPSIASKAGQIGVTRPHPTRITINRNFFRIIDSQEKAYWLGFLAADGSIEHDRGKYQVSLGLQARDLHWLEKFRDIVAPEATITAKKGGSYVVSITSKEMVQDLVSYGLVPGKAKTFTFPEQLSGHLVLPFLLGFFDGDGNLHRFKYINTYSWSLLGTETFLTVARHHLMAAAQVDIKPVRRHKRYRVPHLYEIRAYGPNAVQLDKLLNASGLGLPRKHLQMCS